MHNYELTTMKVATEYNLSIAIVDAIIMTESSGNPWAYNPEPHYRWFWNVRTNAPFRRVSDMEVASKRPPADFPCLAGDPDQEWWAQQASWGLMQLVGAVARESGFKGEYLTELCDPKININFGCKFLATLAKRHLPDYGWQGVLRAYNTGSPSPSSNGTHYLGKIASYYPNIYNA